MIGKLEYECPGVVRVPAVDQALSWMVFLLDARFTELVMPIVGRDDVTRFISNIQSRTLLDAGQVKTIICDCQELIFTEIEVCACARDLQASLEKLLQQWRVTMCKLH